MTDQNKTPKTQIMSFLKSTNLHKTHAVAVEKSVIHFMRYIQRAAAEKLYEDGFFTNELPRRGLVALFYEKDIDFWN